MRNALSRSLLEELSELLSNRLGIQFPEGRRQELQRAIGTAAGELGYSGADACVRALLSAPIRRSDLEILASHLTVGETYFFREPEIFDALRTRILPALLEARRGGDRTLRIWSAGCATGEEPYSLAILLHRLLPDLEEWNIRILATDINPRFLQKAADGVYTSWSFRGTPEWLGAGYFTPAGKERLRIHPGVQRLVMFSYLNLAEDSYPALTNGTNAMDLIFCRNVLMYFTPARMRRVIENLHHCLVDGGWLVVGSAETSHSLFSVFEGVTFPGATFYRRQPAGEGIATGMPLYPWSVAEVLEDVTDTEPEVVGDAPQFDLPAVNDAEALAPSAVPVPAAAEAAPDVYEIAAHKFSLGLYADAVAMLGEWLAQEAADARSMGLMARALANQGRVREAAEWCEKAVALDRVNAGFQYLLASIEHERGRLDEAQQAMKRALYLEPEFVIAHFALGNIARAAGKSRESGKHFANALELLGRYRPEEMLPHSEGITAGRLREIIEVVTSRPNAA